MKNKFSVGILLVVVITIFHSCTFKPCRGYVGVKNCLRNMTQDTNFKYHDTTTYRFWYRHKNFILYRIPTVHGYYDNGILKYKVSDVVFIVKTNSHKIVRVDSETNTKSVTHTKNDQLNAGAIVWDRKPLSLKMFFDNQFINEKKLTPLLQIRNEVEGKVRTQVFQEKVNQHNDTIPILDSLIITSAKSIFPLDRFYSKKDIRKEKSIIISYAVYGSGHLNGTKDKLHILVSKYNVPAQCDENYVNKYIRIYKQSK